MGHHCLLQDLAYDPAIPFLGVYSIEVKINVHKNLYKNVYGSLIRNNPKLEVAHVS